jgi:hypothetical protein
MHKVSVKAARPSLPRVQLDISDPAVQERKLDDTKPYAHAYGKQLIYVRHKELKTCPHCGAQMMPLVLKHHIKRDHRHNVKVVSVVLPPAARQGGSQGEGSGKKNRKRARRIGREIVRSANIPSVFQAAKRGSLVSGCGEERPLQGGLMETNHSRH